jgi:hypothetical protein
MPKSIAQSRTYVKGIIPQFCARLNVFNVLSLFFCNSIDLSPGLDRAPEISGSPGIFGEDCETRVTLPINKNAIFYVFVYTY